MMSDVNRRKVTIRQMEPRKNGIEMGKEVMMQSESEQEEARATNRDVEEKRERETTRKKEHDCRQPPARTQGNRTWCLH